MNLIFWIMGFVVGLLWAGILKNVALRFVKWIGKLRKNRKKTLIVVEDSELENYRGIAREAERHLHFLSTNQMEKMSWWAKIQKKYKLLGSLTINTETGEIKRN